MLMMNGFERRREQKKESIRRAALELFKVYGIRKVTINEIATKAMVSPVTIYNYFGDKQNLVREVVKWLAASMASHYQSILKSDQPYLERLKRVVFEKSENVRTYHGEVMQTLLSQDPEIRRFVEELWPQANEAILAFLEEGKRQGYVNHDLSQRSLLLYLEMFRTLGYTHPELVANGEESSKLLEDMFNLFLYGLMGRETDTDLLRSIRVTDRSHQAP